MAITDWDSLKTAVQSYAGNRTDTTFVNQIETFVDLAEHRIYHGVGTPRDPLYSEPLRCDELVTSSTVSFTASSGTVPSDCLGIRRLDRDDDTMGLDYLTPDALALDVAREASSTTLPRYYTVEGTTIKLSPSGYGSALNILYWAEPTGISSSNTTNAILTAYPTLYLYATLMQAFSWMDNPEKMQTYLAETRAAVSGINSTKIATQHGGGSMIAKPRVVIGA